MDFNPTTKLEAVNQLLSMIGERSVNSLEDAPVDAILAKDLIDEVAVNIQSGNWYFNTDPDVELLVNGAGEITVAANVVRINPDKDRNYPYLPVLRTGTRKLYDKKYQTYLFEKSMYADVTYLLDWTDLPQPARQYIVAMAGRIYNDRALNDPDLKQSLYVNEQIAKEALTLYDSDEADYNIFEDPSVAQTIWRRNPLNFSW